MIDNEFFTLKAHQFKVMNIGFNAWFHQKDESNIGMLQKSSLASDFYVLRTVTNLIFSRLNSIYSLL